VHEVWPQVATVVIADATGHCTREPVLHVREQAGVRADRGTVGVAGALRAASPTSLASSLAATSCHSGGYPFSQVTAQVVPMHVALDSCFRPAPVPPI